MRCHGDISFLASWGTVFPILLKTKNASSISTVSSMDMFCPFGLREKKMNQNSSELMIAASSRLFSGIWRKSQRIPSKILDFVIVGLVFIRYTLEHWHGTHWNPKMKVLEDDFSLSNRWFSGSMWIFFRILGKSLVHGPLIPKESP